MPHPTEAASGSPVFRIAAAGIGELCTSRGRSAFRSLDAGNDDKVWKEYSAKRLAKE